MPQLEFPEFARNRRWELITADGGLLCFGASGAQRGILVCNPMTKEWRELPDDRLDYRVSTHHWMPTRMVVDECGSSYKIILAGDCVVGSYDSTANRWSAVEPLPHRMVFKCGVYRNGEMYLLGKMVNDSSDLVMILELTTLRWRVDIIPMPATSVQYPFIVELSGEVYLVGGSTVEPMESILVFRLDSGGKWTRVSKYANFAFLIERSTIYGCGAHGDRIYVVTSPYDRSWLDEFDIWIIVYNVATGVWEERAIEDFHQTKDIYCTEFAFQPNLVAAP